MPRIHVARLLSLVLIGAVAPAAAQAPLRTAPTVAWAATAGFRDWGAVVKVGDLVIGANVNGRGGLYAVDDATGKVKWRVGTEHGSEAPVSDGRVVVMPWWQAEAIAAYAVTTGKPMWRVPFRFVRTNPIALADGLVIAQNGTDGSLHAFDVATGAERWTLKITTRFWACGAAPVIADGTIYVASGVQTPADAKKDYFLHAIDLQTGQERWRYNPQPEYPNAGTCLTAIVPVGDTIVATGDAYLYGIDRQTGRHKYRAEPRDHGRREPLFGLVSAGAYVFGMSRGQISAFDPRSGRVAWQLDGAFRDGFAAMAAADGVLYFQGFLPARDAARGEANGILHAIDVATREFLWDFTYRTEEPWSFHRVTPFDGGLYVDTYKVLLKLK